VGTWRRCLTGSIASNGGSTIQMANPGNYFWALFGDARAHRFTDRAGMVAPRILRQPWKYVCVPAGLMLGGVAVAMATWSAFPQWQPHKVTLGNLRFDELNVPVVLWLNLCAGWNPYHAGAQNFGMLCIFRGRRFSGTAKLVVLGSVTACTIFLSYRLTLIFPSQIIALICTGLITVRHWVIAIGVSAHVHGRHSLLRKELRLCAFSKSSCR